ncbi:MAG: hypothetical protein JO280_04990, partial [Mycobacteriaceae bacterium]|nr:hypothetical protein [Mycobacteriaceae bacterium]
MPCAVAPADAAAPSGVFGRVVVVASLGGIAALHALLEGLPGDFDVPIAVVQQRGAGPAATLSARRLIADPSVAQGDARRLPVCLAVDR